VKPCFRSTTSISRGPTQADQTAGVVDYLHDAVEPDLAAEAFYCLDMAFEGAGRIGRRVTEAGEIRRQRSAPC
jgi:hypothetical protein